MIRLPVIDSGVHLRYGGSVQSAVGMTRFAIPSQAVSAMPTRMGMRGPDSTAYALRGLTIVPVPPFPGDTGEGVING